ncbi:ribonuclease P protein component [cf. Phormidesmis sp. LEGE 11477]|uniref:ribonuclease P protein component n=1 Tax=cf. Phormidesmis sp. LEGE 11477 TaxID=1828680 RepID=UPI00187EF45C|nr:ribonuclease P protein component [cf. Phormidesmis sp. LEGE 11477]
MSLPKQNRLKLPRDFSRVHRKGRRTATANLAMRALKVKVLEAKPSKKAVKGKSIKSKAIKGVDGSPSTLLLCRGSRLDSSSKEGLGPQFGVSISRKVSKRAVVRNRIKRQLFAIIRQYLPEIDPAWQVAIVVRPSAVECSFDDFLRELEYLLKKLEIVTRAKPGETRR